MRCVRLFQLYLEDQYHNSESKRLTHLRKNQQNIQTDDFHQPKELFGDSSGIKDDAKSFWSCWLFFLTTTYLKEDRYMQKQEVDIVAVSNDFRRL